MYSKLGVMVHPCNPALGRPGQEAIQGFRVSLRTGCFRVRPCPKKPINMTKEESKFIKTRKKKIYYVSAHKKKGTRILTEVLFTIAPKWKQPKCSLIV